MNQQQILEDIQYIKEVISSSFRYTNLSGLAAIISGACALMGSVASGFILQGWKVSTAAIMANFYQLAAVWLLVFISAALLHIYFILRKARKTGQPAWSHLAKLILYAFSPSFLLGIVLTLFLLAERQVLWIPAIWMINYGLGVWSAGLFSVPEPRWLGALFMLTGIFTLFWLEPYSLLLLALSFGFYHIAYGIRIYRKYGG
jgi:hypothetical protein